MLYLHHNIKRIMASLKMYRKPLIITSIVIISTVILILGVQMIVGSVITNKLENALENREGVKYVVRVGKAKVNLFTMTLIFKDVEVIPDSSFLNELKTSTVKHRNIFHVIIPNLRIRNIGVIGFLQNKYVEVGDFILKEAIIDIYTDGKASPPDAKENIKKRGIFNLDSIPIPGIGGSAIHSMQISNFGLNLINFNSSDTLLSAKRLNLSFDEVNLIKNENDSTSFRFRIDDLDISMFDEKFLLPGGKYALSFKKMDYDLIDSLLIFDNLSIEPRYSRTKMVNMSAYQYEIFNADIKRTEVSSINLRNILLNSEIYLSNIKIDGLVLNIFKDKRLPFDEEKRPKLPQQALKELKQDIYIDSINIINSELVYSERHKLMKELMEVKLGDFTVVVRDITSVDDSILAGSSMFIGLSANLQKKIPMGIDINLPMNSVVDTFSFSGFLQSGNMKMFNSVVLPVLGVKFGDGYLDRLDFVARANGNYSIGEMTMQYHDLEGNVQKQDMVASNKFLSWLANSVIIRNNPSKDNELRTVPMYFERVDYKGLGNYLWKTLQSGIMATIVPTVDNKVQKSIDTKLGIDSETIRKREKEEKRTKRRHKKNR